MTAEPDGILDRADLSFLPREKNRERPKNGMTPVHAAEALLAENLRSLGIKGGNSPLTNRT